MALSRLDFLRFTRLHFAASLITIFALGAPLAPPSLAQRPEHVGARHFDIQLVPLDAPPSAGNGFMTLGDVWEENTIEEYVCSPDEEDDLEAQMQSCREDFWDRYDPSGQIRGSDLDGFAEECMARGTGEYACQRQRQEIVDERKSSFLEDCYGSDSCREAFEYCDTILDQCTNRYTEWRYYEERTFPLPCRPFDKMDWEDKRVRDDWEGGRRGIIEKIDNRGFVGDPNPINGFLGLSGKPMKVRVVPEAVHADGTPFKIGSYFFADYRYGRIAITSFDDPSSFVEMTFPFEYKDAGVWRHGWINDLWVCEKTFTRDEIQDLYEKWGILPPGEDEDETAFSAQ